MPQSKTHQKQNKFIQWVSNRSAYTKNKTINAFMFFVAVFIIGGTNYFIMFKVFVPTFFLLDLLIIVLMVSPIFFFKKTMFDRIYLPIIIGFLTMFYMLNTCFYLYFGTVFSLKDIFWALQNAAQVGMHSSSIKWWVIVVDVVLFAVFSVSIILYNALWRFQESKIELKLNPSRKIVFATSLLVGSMFMYELSLQLWCVGERSKQITDIDYVNYSPNSHFKKLGMFGYYTQEIRQLSLDKGESVEDIKAYLKAGSYLNDDYTGLLSNANVMVIMIETGDDCMLGEKTTPNLWNLLNGGINFTHNYSYNHTNVSDSLAINGNYPQYQFLQPGNMSMPFNIPNILNAKNYQTYFSADLAPVNDTFDTMSQMKSYGFDQCLYHDEVIPNVEPWRYEWVNYTRDSIFMKGLEDKITSFSQDNPFYMQYLTIHMHMDQILTPQNAQMFEDLESEFGKPILDNPATGWANPFDSNSEAGKRYRRFTLKAMDFDKGLGSLMQTLYESGNPYLANTLLVVYGDHAWYEDCVGVGGTFAQQLRQVYDIDNIKQYPTVMGFYHPDLNDTYAQQHDDNHDFDYPTWPSVIAPTILDLLGETYNPRMYLNKSVFDETYDDNEIFYSFWTTNYMNEHYSSTDHYSIHQIFDDNDTRQMFIDKLKEIRYQMRIIDSIYKQKTFNYYNYQEFMPD